MRRRLLRFLAIQTFRRASWLMPLLVLVTVVLLWPVGRMYVETGVASYLPGGGKDPNPGVELTTHNYRLEPLLCHIRLTEGGTLEDLKRIGTFAAEQLADERYFMEPVYTTEGLGQEYFETLSDRRLISLLTPADWQELKRLTNERISDRRLRMLRAYRTSGFLPARAISPPVRDPLGALNPLRVRLTASRGPTHLHVRDGYLISPDGRTLTILLFPLLSPEDGQGAVKTYRCLENTREFVKRRTRDWGVPFEMEFVGKHVTVAGHFDRLGHNLALVLAMTLPMTLLLLMLVFRKLEAWVFVIGPPLLGTAWTVGALAWMRPSISFVTILVLMVVFAMGMISSTHLYHRFTFELYRARNYYRALHRSYLETGRGVLGSAIVRLILFFFLMMTSFNWSAGVEGAREGWVPGLFETGQAALLAVLLTLISNLLSIPLLASFKHRLARGRISPVNLYDFGLKYLYNTAISNPRPTMAVMLLVTVVLGFQAAQLNFSPGFTSTSGFFFRFERDEPRNEGGLPVPGRPLIVIVEGETLQTALEANDTLYETLSSLRDDHNILAIDSLRSVLPSLRSQEESYAELAALDLAPFIETTRAVSEKNDLVPDVYEPFLRALRQFKRWSEQPEYIEFTAEAPDSMRGAVERFVTHDPDGIYHVATPVYPYADGWDGEQLVALEQALSERMPTPIRFAGDPVLEQRLAERINYNLALMILLSGAAIFISFLIHFRRLRMGVLTFIPVLIETLWLCGALTMVGVRMHFFTILALPLALSLMMDNALQLGQFYVDRAPVTVRAAMRSVSRVAPLTGGMLGLLLGTFALIDHEGLRDFGLLLTLAACVSVAATALVQPALLRLFGRGQSLVEAFQTEGEEDLS